MSARQITARDGSSSADLAASGGAAAQQSPLRRARRVLITAVTTGLFGYFVLVGLGCVLQERLIFPRHFAGSPTVEPASPRERWWIDQAGGSGRTEAWVEIAAGRSAESPGPAVIYFHGNGEIIEEVPELVWRLYLSRGVSVAMLEYRGYGLSDGAPGQEAITSDALALRDRLVGHPAVDAERLVYHGRSIGGGAAAQLAAREPPAALILETTFTSVTAMARRFLVPPFLLRHPYRTDRVLEEFDGPVLIMHGDADTIVPVGHGRRLGDISPTGEYHEFPGEGHNDFPVDRARYERIIDAFLERAGVVGAGGEPRGGRGSGAP